MTKKQTLKEHFDNHFELEEKAFKDYLDARLTNVNDKMDVLEIVYVYFLTKHTLMCHNPRSVENDIYTFKKLLVEYIQPKLKNNEKDYFPITIIDLFKIYNDLYKLTYKHFDEFEKSEVNDETPEVYLTENNPKE